MALQTPGTPAIILPAFVAPLFTSPSIPEGGVITTVTLEGEFPSHSPFTFGQVFKVGEMAPVDGVVGRISGSTDIPLQIDVKATHADGSIRHAIISGVSNVSGLMYLIKTHKQAAKSAPLLASPVKVSIDIAGEEYTATSSYDGTLWLDGDIAKERINLKPLVNASGAEHPLLMVQFSERAYITGHTRTDVVVEHTRAYKALTDLTYDVKIVLGAEVAYQKTALVHFPCTRYKKTVWQGGNPQVHVKHNAEYLIATKAIPNYDLSNKPPETLLDSFTALLSTPAFEPMKTGRFVPAMGTTGGRPDIGLAPDSYVIAIITQDARAKAMMLASADMGASFSSHRRSDSGEQFNIINYPATTLYGTPSDSFNVKTGQRENLTKPVTTSTLFPDVAHQPAFAYIPYLLTGDYFYLEELNFWNNWNLYTDNPGYRMWHLGLVKKTQLRGQGWSLRTMAEAAYINPDNYSLKAASIFWLESNLSYYNTKYTDGADNSLGIITDFGPIYPSIGGASTAVAPWQDDFFTQAVGHASELGFEGATKLLKWKAQFPIGRMVGEGFCYTDAAAYSIRVRETPTTPYYTTLAECSRKSFTEDYAPLFCNSAARVALMNSKTGNKSIQGEIYGYATSPEGYPSNMQPALAMSVDSGVEGGTKAWELFINRTVKPNYNSRPQFAILPRVAVAVLPPPVIVTPPPVVIPATKVLINNECIANLDGITVILASGVVSLFYTNQKSNSEGVIEITDSRLVVGVKYKAVIFDKSGYEVASIFPVLSK